MNAINKKIIHFYFTKLLAIQLRGDLWAAAVSRDHCEVISRMEDSRQLRRQRRGLGC